MLYLTHLLALAGVWTIAVMSPGPNFVTITHHAIARSRRAGILAALGVSTASTIWIAASLVGLEILFVHLSWLVEMIRIIGAVYLTFLGFRMIWTAHLQKRPLRYETASTAGSSPWRVGLLTNVSNPKTAAFFASLFASLLPPHSPLWFQITCLVTMAGISVTWNCLVACIFSLKPVAHTYQHMKKWIDTICGCILVGLGLRLAVVR